MKKKINPDLLADSGAYGIPYRLAEIIYYERKGYEKPFLTKLLEWIGILKPAEWTDYEAMLQGASIAYRHQDLLGRKLPSNSPLEKEVSDFLAKKGLVIQYHPYYGMIILKK